MINKENMPLLIIAGPTAVGKSGLAINLAKKLNTEIISCDSAQVYKYMDIGTAKPTHIERSEIKHHLIDYVEPNEEYSAVRYKNDCNEVIKQLSQKKVPLLCGGTGMYFNSVLYEMNFGNAYKSEAVRNELTAIGKTDGALYLYNMLKEIDSVTAEKLHPNDTLRIIRAIEIYKVSGIKKSDLKQDYKKLKRYKYLFVVLNTDRAKLYELINKRVDLMIESGLIAEVKKLKDMGYENCKSMQAIGYKEIIKYLNGGCNLSKAIQDIKQFSRNYAKRQLTWFKSVEDAVWYDISSGSIAEDIIKRYNELGSSK